MAPIASFIRLQRAAERAASLLVAVDGQREHPADSSARAVTVFRAIKIRIRL